jgi:hypothetical protein
MSSTVKVMWSFMGIEPPPNLISIPSERFGIVPLYPMSSILLPFFSTKIADKPASSISILAEIEKPSTSV